MAAKMILREFTSETNGDRSKIVRVRARISNEEDLDLQTEWIEFQVVVDFPTVHGGALLRNDVLLQVSELLRSLAGSFQRTHELGLLKSGPTTEPPPTT